MTLRRIVAEKARTETVRAFVVDRFPLFGYAETVEPELLGHAADFHAGQADLRGLVGAIDCQRLGLPAFEAFAGRSRAGVGHEAVELTVFSVTLSVAEKEPAPVILK